MGAHLTEEEIFPEDVPVIIDFVEAILEYLYVAPAKICAMQEHLGRLNTTKTSRMEKLIPGDQHHAGTSSQLAMLAGMSERCACEENGAIIMTSEEHSTSDQCLSAHNLAWTPVAPDLLPRLRARWDLVTSPRASSRLCQENGVKANQKGGCVLACMRRSVGRPSSAKA
jgi:hypothetical protein